MSEERNTLLFVKLGKITIFLQLIGVGKNQQCKLTVSFRSPAQILMLLPSLTALPIAKDSNIVKESNSKIKKKIQNYLLIL